VRRITETKGCEYNPVWSPDGKWIAYTATRRDIYDDRQCRRRHARLGYSSIGGRGKRCSAEIRNRRVRDPQWSPDSPIRYFFWRVIAATRRSFARASKAERSVGSHCLLSKVSWGGVFDIEDSKFRVDTNSAATLAAPFQITGFSVSRRSRSDIETIAASCLSLWAPPIRPAEVWSAVGSGLPLQGLVDITIRL
jgi:hypothetical protein